MWDTVRKNAEFLRVILLTTVMMMMMMILWILYDGDGSAARVLLVSWA